LFTDRKNPEIKYTSPGSGRITAINRGAKRVFQSIEIELDDKGAKSFTQYGESKLDSLTREQVQELLLESGEWVSLRRRPFGIVAEPQETPRSIFVTAMDSNPLAPDPEVVLQGKEKELVNGLKALKKLTDGPIYYIKHQQAATPKGVDQVAEVVSFSGPHPAGNVGTHIHFVDPVGGNKFVWHAQYQDVVAIGHLFATGKIYTERVVALAGPSVAHPRLLRTRRGANTHDITREQLQPEPGETTRVVAGSVFNGHTAEGPFAFLGRYHNQITALPEGTERFFMGWIAPGFNRFSIKNVVFSRLFPGKKFRMTTAVNGSPRAIVPIAAYEKVMPLDIEPTFLLRSLLANDLESSEKLGALELAEEDLALCTLVSPGKEDFGPVLRNMLTRIQKEG
jgi:Na+-transporting NADH:ubiquinone oxidoreductase subunit A